MPISKLTTTRKHVGFSLIEMLVVLLIIGITFSFAIIGFGDFGKKRQILADAEQFIDYVQLVRQQSILENKSFQIVFKNRTYQALRQTSDGRYESMKQTGFIRARRIHNDTTLRLDLPKNAHHRLMIYASYTMTPFTLHWDTNTEKDVVLVRGSLNGVLTLSKNE